MQRIPRISGLTQILSLYHEGHIPSSHQSKTKKGTNQSQSSNTNKLTIGDIHKHIVKHYVSNQYTINGTFTSISKLAQYMGITERQCLSYINRYMIVNDRQLKTMMDGELARVALFGSFFGIQEAAHKASEQLSILASSQAGEYRPFISGEVNRSIKNLLDSQKLVMEMAQMLQPKTPTISVINQNQMAVQNHAYLSPLEAQKLVEAKVQDMGLTPGSHAQLALIGPPLGLGMDNGSQLGTPSGSQAYQEGLTSLPNIIANQAQEDELQAHIMRRKAREQSGDLSPKEEKEFRDFRIDTGDGDVEVI